VDTALVASFVLAAFLLSVAPGPDMLFIVANAAAGGRRAGLVSALGTSSGLALHTAAAALGLGALIRAAPAALNVVREVGTVFLVYLAVSSWRASRGASRRLPSSIALPKRCTRKVDLMATLTNVANPKIILFYLAFLPQFLTTSHAAWPVWSQLFVLGGLFIVVGLPLDATVGLTAGHLSDKILQQAAVRRRLERVAALIFGGLAVRLAIDR
jgi:threonine/homoserine/homoserine lactone efflux protein